MKILFVTDLYPIGNEKIAKALFYFVQEWQKQGHEVEVIRSNFILNTKVRKRKIIEEKVYNENGTKIYNLNFHTPFLFNVYNKLPKDFSLKNYDVLISHMPCGALMAQQLLKRDKIKYICSVHNSDLVVLKDLKYSLFFRQALKNAYKIADKISSRSPMLKKKIEQIIPNNKTFVAYSGIEEEFINNEIKPFNKEKIEVTTIASLIKRKNIDVIIETINEFPNINLNIIGEGREEKRLKSLVKGKNIQFYGNISRLLVIELLKNSDIFVLLSENETFGLSYLEAMATGNIVIGKKNEGIDGILINNDNGYLIEANKQELTKCLQKILSSGNDEITRIKRNSLKTIKGYTVTRASDNYIKNIQ